ncbi:MAG: preprotein translocase subunit SecG [Rickettsiales bacterium]|nr:preprotein translocase subunit SecG [Rickettsiales bacterium]|tara:strand:- start:1380 stop:1733 length:354 start_codon:yes stop_codon:yes gene_type:complete
MFAVVLSIHIIVCIFLVVLVLLQKSEGGGLGIGQSSAGLGDFLSARGTSNLLTKTTSFLAVCFFLTSLSLVIVANKNFNKGSIIDSTDDSIIDRLDLIPEEFDVEKNDNEELKVPIE